MSLPDVLSRPETLALLLPIAGVLMFGFISLTKILIKHRERMAMIEQGMHPDVEAHEPVEPSDTLA